MSGALFQLVAYGVEDLILTHEPEVTYFKSVYKRHTSCTIESIPQNFIGKVDFGRRLSCIISKQADLVSKMYIEVTLPKVEFDVNNNIIYAWVKNIGYKLIKNVNIEIGGQIIDKHYSDWLYIWNELTCEIDKKDGLDHMIGNIPENYDFNLHIQKDINSYVCYIPLNFWFSRSPNLALPLCSLKYHEIKLNIEFEELENCLLQADVSLADGITNATYFQVNENTYISGVKNLSSLPALKAHLYVDFIFLDEKEKKMFIQKEHEYCIEQVQYNEDAVFLGDFSSLQLNFNHPVKELIWVFQYDKNIELKNFFNYTNTADSMKIDITLNNNVKTIVFSENIVEESGQNPVDKVNLFLNGTERFAQQTGGYTNLIQQYNHHTNISLNGINCYSFSIYPENVQPSGTCNFSMVDDSILENSLKSYFYNEGDGVQTIDSGTGIVRIYAINYNILKIMGGMGGIMFSN